MTDAAGRTSGAALGRLFHPFERGLLTPPEPAARFLVLGAQAGFRAPQEFAAQLAPVQAFRPHFLALQRAGFDVTPEAQGEGFDGALVLLGRSRRENEIHLARALKRVVPGGAVVAAGGRTDGAASLRRRLSSLLPLGGHAARQHGEVFWLRRPDRVDAAVLSAFGPRATTTADGRFVTAEGGFSADAVDPGSLLLARAVPDDIAGAGADFGAGWGYLAATIAARFPAVTALDLYEAHRPSLDAARRNMAAQAPQTPCRFLWHDLLREKPDRFYDFIGMNPPFHRGRAAEPGIGMAMIDAAAGALKGGGRLFMVANRGLPYEVALARAFREHGELCREAGFKVLWGTN